MMCVYRFFFIACFDIYPANGQQQGEDLPDYTTGSIPSKLYGSATQDWRHQRDPAPGRSQKVRPITSLSFQTNSRLSGNWSR